MKPRTPYPLSGIFHAKEHVSLGVLSASIVLSLCTIIVVAAVEDMRPAPVDPFDGMHFSAPDTLEAYEFGDDDVLNAPIVRYESETFSYSLTYPGHWDLDDTRREFAGDVITDPHEHIVITISETKDPDVFTDEAMDEVAQSIKESLNYDPSFALQSFERLLWKGRHTIFTDGTRKVGRNVWHTREYNVFRPQHHGILNISISTLDNAETLHQDGLDIILESLTVCPFDENFLGNRFEESVSRFAMLL